MSLAVLLLPLLLLQAPSATDAAAIDARERAIAAALHSHDRATFDETLARDFVLRASPDIGRAEWIRNAVSLCWGDRSDLDDFSARQAGEAVVATFVLTFYVDPLTCQPAVLRSLVTDVWTRTDGRWVLRVRHAGPVPPAGVAGQFGAVPQAPPIWTLTGELSLLASSGNSPTRTLGLSSDATHRAARAVTDVHVGYLTSSADQVTRARSTTLQARHGVTLTKQVGVFGRGAYARDRFAGIEHRTSVEAGLTYTPALPPRQSFQTDAGVGFTSEARVAADTLRFAIATGAARYGWTFRPGSDVQESITMTADLEQRTNWRMANTLALTVSVTTRLSLKASSAVEYRHLPVPGFGRTDVRTAVALVFAFEKRP